MSRALDPLDALLERLHEAGVQIDVVGDRIRLEGRRCDVEPELLAEVRRLKPLLLARYALSLDGTSGPRRYPATSGQRRLFALHRLDPDCVAYHIVDVFDVLGPVDPDVLEDALRAVVDRHDALRTRLSLVDGVVLQEVLPQVDVPISRQVVPDLDAAVKPVPFDLSAAPLLRARWLEDPAGRRRFMLEVHHAVMDGSSRGAVLTDLQRALCGEALPPASLQLGPYAEWERAWVRGTAGRAALTRRLAALRKLPPPLALPLDRSRPAVLTFEGARVPVRLSREDEGAIRALASRFRAGVSLVLLASWATTLHGLTGCEDLLLGMPALDGKHPEIARGEAVGMFVHTAVLRLRPRGDAVFSSWIEQVRAELAEAVELAPLPLDMLIEHLGVSRQAGRNPLFDVLFSFQRTTEAVLTLPGGGQLREIGYDPDTSQFDLGMIGSEEDGRLRVELEYAVALFDRETIESIAERLAQVIRAVSQDAARPLQELVARSHKPVRTAGSAEPPSGGGERPDAEARRAVAAIWEEVLGRPPGDDDEDFFLAGGHSLLAVDLLHRVHSRLGVQVGLGVFFSRPTVDGLTGWLSGVWRGALVGTPGPAFLGEQVVPEEEPLPLSFAQERIWVERALRSGTDSYTMPYIIRVEGPLDTGAMRRAIGRLVNRHAALRTKIVETADGPMQVISRSGQAANVETVEDPDEAAARTRALAGRPVEVEGSSLFTADIVQAGRGELTWIVLRLHHLIADAWSLGILRRELSRLYASERAGGPPAALPSALACAAWTAHQRQALDADEQGRLVEAWRSLLGPTPEELSLPDEHPGRPRPRGREGAVPVAVGAATVARLRELAAQQGTTLFTTILAAFRTLLFRHTGQRSVAIGVPTAMRSDPAVANTVGLLLNLLPIPGQVQGDPSFRHMVAAERSAVQAALTLEALPFDLIVRALAPQRRADVHPLFQAFFDLQPAAGELRLEGAERVTIDEIDTGAAKYDLHLGVCAAEAQAAGQDGSGVCGDVADWGHDGLGRGVADESGWLGGRREGRAGVPRSFHRRDGVGHGALRRPGGCAAA